MKWGYLLKTMTLAAMYVGLAIVSYLFPTATGNIPLVWLPAGLTLGWLILFGYRLWPAVTLGAFIAVLLTHAPIGFAFTTAIGYTLQALGGVYLLRRFGFNVALAQAQDMLKLIFFGAFLSTIISATLGVVGLELSGISYHNAWLWWWLSDAIGVLFITPILLVGNQWLQRRNVAEPILFPLSSFLLAVAFIAGFTIWRIEEQSLRTKLRDEASEMIREIDVDVEKNIQYLVAIEGLYASSREVNRSEFEAFAELLLKHVSTAQALAWIPYVPHAERATFEQTARQEGFSGFQFIEQDTAHQFIPAASRAEYFPVYFLKPYIDNKNALGYDLGSDSSRLETILRARDAGQPTVSAVIELVTESTPLRGLLIFVPIYLENTSSTSSVETRRANLHGFAAGAFRLDAMVAEALKTLQQQDLELFLFDITSRNNAEFLSYYPCLSNPRPAADAAMLPPNELQTDLYYTSTLAIGGRFWQAIIRPCPAYLADGHGWGAWAVLVIGLILSGTIIAYVGVRQQTNAQLAYHAHLLGEINDAVLAFNHQFVLTAWNRAAENIYGWKASEMIGHPYQDVLPTEYVDIDEDQALRTLQKTGQLSTTLIQLRKDDKLIIVAAKTVALRDENKQITGYVSVNHDITEQKQAEDALRKSEARYRAIIEDQTELICRLTPGLVITFANEAYRRFFDRSTAEIVGHDLSPLVTPEILQEIRNQITKLTAEEPVISHEHEQIRGDGSTRWMHWSNRGIFDDEGQLIEIQSVGQDVTEKKQLEEQLLQSQKMEAIGRLAGGIAHDFNNILMPIMGYTELGMTKLSPDDKLYTDLKRVQEAAYRAADLTHQILAYSRKQVLEMQIIDLNMVIMDFEKMAQRLIGEDVELRTFLKPDLYRVNADKGQIGQVLLNLVVNARDAMPTGGKLTIETASVYLDETYVKKYADDHTPGRYVMLAVSDTGHGMDVETQQQIFDPFFTTKAHGQGTGLGLSTVFGIIKQHGGNIWVYSEPDKGTTFKIYLPQIETIAATPKTAISEPESLLGAETILVVEDEEMVRTLICETLTAHGYTVLEAQNINNGLQLAAEQQHIDLLFTDVVMPEMNGKELYQKVVALHPHIKVLYMSGYTDDVIVHHGILDDGINFLQKPFSVQTLTKKVRQVFD
ncbi:MAG: CHASE domain-containing protein [Anaerolineae bacterium]|nr:CHASE domain-containing protein [Anaerolineae bacterium]